MPERDICPKQETMETSEERPQVEIAVVAFIVWCLESSKLRVLSPM